MALTGDFTFSRATHEYRVGATVVPSVTGIVRGGGLYAAKWFKPEYLERGTAVHEATMHYDLTKERPDLPPEWRPYFDAYADFTTSVSCQWSLIEQPRVHRQRQFAGTIDRYGMVNGMASIVEIKTGYPAPWHGVQLAGQDLLLDKARHVRQRLVVYLRNTGKYRLRECDDPGDYLTFLSSLHRYWEQRHGRVL